MATGVVITVAENLFTVLTSQEFKQICSVFGYNSQLDELASTVSTIKGILLDADLKYHKLTHDDRQHIEGLKEAVYDIDDVVDEFNILAQKENKQGGKASKKVRRFFSRFNQVSASLKMSNEIKIVRAKLDNIAKDSHQFGSTDVYVPVKIKKESGSYVIKNSIIGRDAEKEAIVGVLLAESNSQPNNHDALAFVTIVGMGGLGKTALAQLVYNDEKIKETFEVRLWVCVSNKFGLEQIFAKITGASVGIGMKELQRGVRSRMEGKKYLLVLDNVWDENHIEWVELRDFLMLGANGSRVLATTRSKEVAGAIENNQTYELQGLSDESSWHLFRNMAFEQHIDNDLVDIGKEVVKKCANIPLSIRVVGSLLNGQHKDKWLSFEGAVFGNSGSSKDGRAEEGIMSILKYSYNLLSPSLKSCLSYCKLFPKDFEISKRTLIWLWMAQGFLDLPNDGRSMEAVGADYCLILLQRCFFQDIEVNDNSQYYKMQGWYKGKFYKMHDLIHDLAQEVAGKESLMLDTAAFQFDKKIRHLAISNDGCKLLSVPGSCLGETKKLRSLHHNFEQRFYPTANESNVDTICTNLRCLRVLDLAFFDLKTLPNTLGNLSHLRYLDLSLNCHLEVLPESISRLQNLIVLNLKESSIKELPKRLKNLHNLRHLNLTECYRLTHMPVGMDSMTGLQTLSKFVVARESSTEVKTGQLKDLRNLVHLRGRLEIVFKSGYSCNLEGTSLLSNKANLRYLAIRLEHWGEPPKEYNQGALNEMLECLRPHSNLKGIKIEGYIGIKIPRWVSSLAIFLPCLVIISFLGFDWLYNLSSVSQLQHLKFLKLSFMPNIEFIESDDFSNDRIPFFPSLEELELGRLPKLQGMWSGDFLKTETHGKLGNVRSFPRLHKLEIYDCPCMTTFPRCPSLKTIMLLEVHKAFGFHSNDGSSIDSTIYLDELNIDKVEMVNMLFEESLKSIDLLWIHGLQQDMLSAAADLFQRHASSLRSLCLFDCYGLRSLCGVGIEHLTNLTFLNIEDCDDLDLGEGDERGLTPWKSLKNLDQLEIGSLSNLKYLPEGFRHLTSLRTLRICVSNLESLPEWLPCLTSLRCFSIIACPELKSLPEAIRHMRSLKKLIIWFCPDLSDKCREPDGQEWPKIRHIPFLDFQ